jgi:hypothetical protein
MCIVRRAERVLGIQQLDRLRSALITAVFYVGWHLEDRISDFIIDGRAEHGHDMASCEHRLVQGGDAFVTGPSWVGPAALDRDLEFCTCT